jgi:hypothetical protein
LITESKAIVVPLVEPDSEELEFARVEGEEDWEGRHAVIPVLSHAHVKQFVSLFHVSSKRKPDRYPRGRVDAHFLFFSVHRAH